MIPAGVNNDGSTVGGTMPAPRRLGIRCQGLADRDHERHLGGQRSRSDAVTAGLRSTEASSTGIMMTHLEIAAPRAKLLKEIA